MAVPRPSVRELPSDLLTPVGAYLRIRHLGPSFLLESIEQGRHVGRFSFLGAGCDVVQAGLEADDLFGGARSFLNRWAELDTKGLPPFSGGVVGHVGWDAVSRFEPTVMLPQPSLTDLSDVTRFLLAPVVVAFDHVFSRLLVMALPGHEAEADDLVRLLLAPVPAGADPVAPLVQLGPPPGLGTADTEEEAYIDTVIRCQEHIAAGDVFQIVPSQRHRRQTSRSPFALYRALRAVNPSPYMFFVDDGEVALVGASPETHVSLDQRRRSVLTPIAGTRPRGATPLEDARLEAELSADEKERAEHLMLVDLARNDLSRVCRPGTVEVTRLLEVERFSHVLHLVSKVEGELEGEADAFTLLEATFPAGTVSGAPKIRACQIISQMEPYRRGVYAGAVGYVGADGSMDTCIALRTVVVSRGEVWFQAGAGIVADSDPRSEHRECMLKIAALAKAVELAETGRYGA